MPSTSDSAKHGCAPQAKTAVAATKPSRFERREARFPRDVSDRVEFIPINSLSSKLVRPRGGRAFFRTARPFECKLNQKLGRGGALDEIRARLFDAGHRAARLDPRRRRGDCGEAAERPRNLFATGERSLRRHAGRFQNRPVRFAQPGTVSRPSSNALSLSGKFATVSAKAAASRLSAASQLNSSRIVSNAV